MTRTAAALVLCLLPVAPLAAQEAPLAEGVAPKPRAEASTGSRRTLVPLRILITIARFEGEKRVSSLPFTLLVNTGQPGRTSLRMGIEVPVRVGPAIDVLQRAPARRSDRHPRGGHRPRERREREDRGRTHGRTLTEVAVTLCYSFRSEYER
jgi:hypothetical protein